MQEYLVRVAVLIDTARMQELWKCDGLRGFCIGAAYGPLLLIHSVGSRLRVTNLSAYTELRRWVQGNVFGLRPCPVFVGERAITANVRWFMLLR
jgi:hypothetical protein